MISVAYFSGSLSKRSAALCLAVLLIGRMATGLRRA